MAPKKHIRLIIQVVQPSERKRRKEEIIVNQSDIDIVPLSDWSKLFGWISKKIITYRLEIKPL